VTKATNVNDFEGIRLKHLDPIDKLLKININIYQIVSDKEIELMYYSKTMYKDTLNLAVYNTHFMYIHTLIHLRLVISIHTVIIF